MNDKVRVLFNPRAGSGAAQRALPRVEAELKKHDLRYDVVRTERARDAARLVDQAREDGVDVLCAMGGDGTLNEVAHAYVGDDGAAKPGPALAVVPAGTGGDFKRSLGLGGEIDEAVRAIRHGKRVLADLGHLSLVSDEGDTVSRAFINVTSFGMGGVVDRLVNESPKWLGGKASFFLGSLRGMMAYRNEPVVVLVDGEPFFEGPIFSVAIANGRYFGGSMKIAPEADLSDGMFDVVSLGDLSRLDAVRLSSKIYEGTHVSTPKVKHARGKIVEARPVRASQKVLIDMDGETPGRLPLTAKVVPKALSVVTPG